MNKYIKYGLIAFLGVLLIGAIFAPREKDGVVQTNEPNPENWNLPISKPVVRITDENDRASAIEKVFATIDDAFWDRLGIGKSYIDAYQNPIGDGVIVWIGAVASPRTGYVYLISNHEVYAVSGDVSVLSPQVQSTSSISFTDVKDIGTFRANDKTTLYTICMKDAESFREDGLVEKRIAEKEAACKSAYSN